MNYVFRDLITGSNTNGKQFICHGEFGVFIEPIPSNAPTDWELGPKMKAGEFGAFRAHGWHASGHSPYAFATGKTAQSAFEAACGHFAGNYCAWPNRSPQRRKT